jgi:hypothetical protein
MRPDMASTEAGIWAIAATLSSTGIALGKRLPRQQADGDILIKISPSSNGSPARFGAPLSGFPGVIRCSLVACSPDVLAGRRARFAASACRI